MITALPGLIASLIDGELADGQEHYATLLETRGRPHALDDATIERSIKPYTEQRIFWHSRNNPRPLAQRTLSATQKGELDWLDGQLDRLRTVLSDILELAEEPKQGTTDKVLAKSDLSCIEALHRMTNNH
ncbi:MAG: hypothetical protein MZV64_12465 [Ignavibacteriales bacterium]|nr:hypothetical protein [Ignavibacteriales bacterium]